MRASIIVFFVTAVVFCTVKALECGIDSTSNNKDLRQIAENCMKKKSEDKPKSTIDPEDEEELRESTTEAIKRNKRNDDKKPTQEKQQNSNDMKTDNNNNNNNSNNANSTTVEKDNCVVHCIFGQLGMVDAEGFPVHHRVLNALLNTAKGRELRDFVQDTTDECFQLMEQGDHSDPCQYSVTLVNCLAERGKSNCADWPIGNLPFLKKN